MFSWLGSWCLSSGWWNWISSFWRAVQGPVVGFGGVYGFSMSLGSPLALAVLDMSISAAASEALAAYLHCHLPLLVPGITTGAPVTRPAFHCWPKLARQGLVWVFSWPPGRTLCVAETCVGFPQPPRALPLCRGVCVHLFHLNCPLRGFCALSAPETCPCAERFVCLPGSWLPQPALCAVGFLWASFSQSPEPAIWLGP